MKKEELENLFGADNQAFPENAIESVLLDAFDCGVLELINPQEFSQEVVSVYKKFSVMKQEAPESMKNALFSNIRNFAKELESGEKYLESLVLYRFLIVKSKLLTSDYSSIAELLAKAGLNDTAVKFMKIYEKFEENKPILFLTLANFYNLQLKEYKTAIKYYEKYIEIDKTKAVIYSIVASLYAKVYGNTSLKEQIFYFEKAYALNPSGRLILHGLIFAYEKLGEKVKAKKYYQELLKNNPTDIDYYNYGAFLISCGEFLEGHKYFRHRFLIDDVNLRYPISFDNNKKWDLESDISDKTLLVHYEQGFGDTFMYCRFVPGLKKIAHKVIFVVQDNLLDLIKNSPVISEGIDVISDKNGLSDLEYDIHMALLDAPYVLKTEVSTLPYCDKYLEVSNDKIENYGKNNIKQSDNLKVGIACCGDKSANYNGRDIDFSKFHILSGIAGVEIYSLQYKNDTQLSGITDLGKTFSNFTDTAAAIKNMDIVISTDNVILNLAGALGVKTIGLFNKNTNYRWFKLNTDDTGWYKSVKPVQVDETDNWNPVFSQIINILADSTKTKNK